jgi:hypothetical protein
VRPLRPIQILSERWSGFDPTALEHLLAYLKVSGPASDPILTAYRYLSGPLVTRARRQLVPDRIWYRSVLFNDYQRPADCNHQLTSIFQASAAGAFNCIALYRRVRARFLEPRAAAASLFSR